MNKGIIRKNGAITREIYEMEIQVDERRDCRPGQFLNLYCKDGSRILPRPLSICEWKKDEGIYRLVYKIIGEGTKEFTDWKAGDEALFLGPLGNGFFLDERIPSTDEKVLLIGGGVGVPPLLELSKYIPGEKSVFLGFEKEEILIDDFKNIGAEVHSITTDGTKGTRGTVMDLLGEKDKKADRIYTCGPSGMIKAVLKWAEEHSIPVEVSLEERMACGIGACLVCNCKTKSKNEEWEYKRVCKDGPVFSGEEVIL